MLLKRQNNKKYSNEHLKTAIDEHLYDELLALIGTGELKVMTEKWQSLLGLANRARKIVSGEGLVVKESAN